MTSNTHKTRYPWIANLFFPDMIECTGTIIDPHAVITGNTVFRYYHTVNNKRSVCLARACCINKNGKVKTSVDIQFGKTNRRSFDNPGEFEIFVSNRSNASIILSDKDLNICMIKTVESIIEKARGNEECRNRECAQTVFLPERAHMAMAGKIAGTVCWIGGWHPHRHFQRHFGLGGIIAYSKYLNVLINNFLKLSIIHPKIERKLAKSSIL